MNDHTVTKTPVPATALEPLREKDIRVEVFNRLTNKPMPQVSLSMALNLATASNLDRWEVNQRLRWGDEISTHYYSYRICRGDLLQLQLERQSLPEAQGDDVARDFAALRAFLKDQPNGVKLLEQLVGSMASRLGNLAQCLQANAAEWHVHDAVEEESLHRGRSEMAAKVRTELATLLRNPFFGRPDLEAVPSFSNDAFAPWLDHVPAEALDVDDGDCGDCRGTGIGWNGPCSTCTTCGGTGAARAETEI